MSTQSFSHNRTLGYVVLWSLLLPFICSYPSLVHVRVCGHLSAIHFRFRSQHSGTGDGQQPSTQDSKPSIDNSSVTTAPDVITINEEEAFDPEPVGLDDLTEEEQLELAIAMSHSQQQ